MKRMSTTSIVLSNDNRNVIPNRVWLQTKNGRAPEIECIYMCIYIQKSADFYVRTKTIEIVNNLFCGISQYFDKK